MRLVRRRVQDAGVQAAQAQMPQLVSSGCFSSPVCGSWVFQTPQAWLRPPCLDSLQLESLLSLHHRLPRVINHYSLNEGHRLGFCVSSGIQAWREAGSSVSFFVLESSLSPCLVGFIVECWSFQNNSPKHPQFGAEETSIFHG